MACRAELEGARGLDLGRAEVLRVKLIPRIQQSPHRKGAPAVDQLASGGILPSALAGVIPTHAHWDHVSGLDDLGGVPVMVNALGKRWIDTNASITSHTTSKARRISASLEATMYGVMARLSSSRRPDTRQTQSWFL